MDFNANQMREDALIKDGTYKFTVMDAKEKRSGDLDMMILKLKVEVNGRQVLYWCTLMLQPKMFWMLEHFCMATGMPEKIVEGRLIAADCFDKIGLIVIGARINSKTGELENVTKDFVLADEAPADAAPAAEAKPEFDDEIPDLS